MLPWQGHMHVCCLQLQVRFRPVSWCVFQAQVSNGETS